MPKAKAASVLFKAASASAGLALCFVLSYNTYKELMRHYTGLNPYTPWLKAEIKAAFPLPLAAFFLISSAVLYLVGKAPADRAGIKGWSLIISFYIAFVNLVNASVGEATLIRNFSAGYFLLLLLLFYGYKAVLKDGRVIEAYKKVSSVRLFAYGFILLAVCSAVLSALGLYGAERKTASLAYLALIAGVVSDIYSRYKGGPDEKRG